MYSAVDDPGGFHMNEGVLIGAEDAGGIASFLISLFDVSQVVRFPLGFDSLDIDPAPEIG